MSSDHWADYTATSAAMSIVSYPFASVELFPYLSE